MNSRRFIRSSSQFEDDGAQSITSQWWSHSPRAQMLLRKCGARHKTAMGQSRHFSRRPARSALPRSTDIVRPARLVPTHKVAALQPAARVSRAFLPWRLSDDDPSASRIVAMGRHPKPFTRTDMLSRKAQLDFVSSAVIIAILRSCGYSNCIRAPLAPLSSRRRWKPASASSA
jgi:hypothetical protein